MIDLTELRELYQELTRRKEEFDKEQNDLTTMRRRMEKIVEESALTPFQAEQIKEEMLMILERQKIIASEQELLKRRMKNIEERCRRNGHSL